MDRDTNTTDEPRTIWEPIIGFFVSNKLVVFMFLVMLLGAGLSYAPFRWDLDPLPRDPVAVDALPDISENQQIVFTKWPGRSPRDVEDQVTYPLTTALLGIPGVRSVRSTSVFGISSIYVIFEDDVEFYWSRSRVLEKLASLPGGTLPEGATPTLGPDATALGQVYWYTLEAQDEHGEVVPGAFDLDELRSVQDWNVRYALQSVPGVAEVASVGGYVREYQVDVDPEAMLANNVTIGQVASAVQQSNLDIGARTIEVNQVEYIIRGIGFIEKPIDLENVVITTRDHAPIRIKDVAKVGFGPALRRGALDNGGAEAVGGVVVVRFGDNPLAVIDGLKEKIAEISPGLPERTMDDGRTAKVEIVPFYDRTQLIAETLDTLSLALIQQILVTVMVVLFIMRHLRSSLVVSSLLPAGVLGTFILMKATGVDANVMALGGIAIAIGTMVDMGIVFTENIVHHIERAPPDANLVAVVRRAGGEVAGAVLTSILTTILGFLPIFALTGSEGKLFGPLAYTKTYALAVSFVLAVVILPPIAHLVIRRRRPKNNDDVRARLLSRSAAFDWVMLAIGTGLLFADLMLAGVVVVGIALLRLGENLLPQRYRRFAPAAANGLTVIAVAIALTDYWMPLGPSRSLFANLAFVATMVLGLMTAFWMFQMSYRRVLRWCLGRKWVFLACNVLFVLLGLGAWIGIPKLTDWMPESVRASAPYQELEEAMPGLKDDFMPPFDEGTFLYMPTTTPHASIGASLEMMQAIDAAIADIPEVKRAVGKLGRADSPLDPAPVSMYEVVIDYHSEYHMDEHGRIGTYAVDPNSGEFLTDEHGNFIGDPDGVPHRQWRPHIQSPDDIWSEITKAAEYPGLTGAPKLMPIKTRIVMLQTGMRSSVGIKIQGPELEVIEDFGLQIEALLKTLPEAEQNTVLADRIVGKPYLEIVIDREAIARHGLTIKEVQAVIQIAIGGPALTRTVEGRERYAVRVRYMREERDSVEALSRILVPGKSGEQVPLSQLARIQYVRGPQMIRSEDTFLNAYVTFDPKKGIGDVEAVEAAQRLLTAKEASGELVRPEGVQYRFAGTYENQQRSQKRLMVLVPLALAVIFLLLYLQFRRVGTALMVFSGIALAASGAFLLIWAYGKPWFLDAHPFEVDLRDLFQVGAMKVTVAVWVGFLALFGVATDNGVIVATYLTQTFARSPARTVTAIRERVVEAGARRVRPCVMTTATTMLALLPVITSPGRGADMMVPMALPTVGGIGLSLVTLLTVPVLFSLGEEIRLRRRARVDGEGHDGDTDAGRAP